MVTIGTIILVTYEFKSAHFTPLDKGKLIVPTRFS